MWDEGNAVIYIYQNSLNCSLKKGILNVKYTSIKLAIKILAWILGGREDWWSDFITNIEKIGLAVSI